MSTFQDEPADRNSATVALLMIFVAATLAIVAALHLGGVLGGSEPFDPTAAGVAEALIGVALAGGAAGLLRRSAHAREIAIATTLFAIAGFVLGLTFTVRGGGAFDVAYHLVLLPVLVLILIVLLRKRDRTSA
jgi:peptidoglycan/LPS O-acetylase OafA/YrhL